MEYWSLFTDMIQYQWTSEHLLVLLVRKPINQENQWEIKKISINTWINKVIDIFTEKLLTISYTAFQLQIDFKTHLD